MPHDLEVPKLPLTVRRVRVIKHKLVVKRFEQQHLTPFAAEPATFVLDNDDAPVPAYYRIIGRGRFTPRQQLNIDRAERAISRVGEEVKITTFPAHAAGRVVRGAPARSARRQRPRTA